MTKILALAWNDIQRRLSDRTALVFIVVLPVVFTLVLGGLVGGEPATRIPVLVADADQSALSAQLVRALADSPLLQTQIESPSDAGHLFEDKDRPAPALVTIPAGFEAALLGGGQPTLSIRKAPNDSRVLAAEQAIKLAAERVSGAIAVARAAVGEAERLRPFASEAERSAFFQQTLVEAGAALQNPPAAVHASLPVQPARRSASGAEQSSAGQMVTWVLITLLGAAEVFVDERLLGTLRRLAVAPLSKATVLAGKILGELGLGLAQMTVLVGFGGLALGVNWGKSPAGLVALLLAFGLAAVALGVLLGTLATSRGQAGWLAVGVSMLMAALGGAWWPLEITPPFYQTVVRVLPSTWAMTGLTNLLVRGQGLADVLPQVAILLGFAVVFFVLGIRRFRFA